jgi:NhaP-type Na+/H+ or K+/H+ antiporter
MGLLKTLASGVVLGLAGALVLLLLMRAYRVPEYLENPFALMMVVLVYTGSDFIRAESGLLSVTFMGMAVANQRWVAVHHIVEFKENLRVLLISSLFILLAARLEVGSLELLGAGSLVFLAALIVIVRPAAVFLSTLGSGLGMKEKVFLSWMAPRGIVAAAVSSVFVLRLEDRDTWRGRCSFPWSSWSFWGLSSSMA